jgi:hypothetical protein
MNDHPNGHCSVPDEGEWFPIFHLDTMAEAMRTFVHCVESDEEWAQRYDDFRVAVPAEARLKAKARADKARAEGRPMRRAA